MGEQIGLAFFFALFSCFYERTNINEHFSFSSDFLHSSLLFAVWRGRPFPSVETDLTLAMCVVCSVYCFVLCTVLETLSESPISRLRSRSSVAACVSLGANNNVGDLPLYFGK